MLSFYVLFHDAVNNKSKDVAEFCATSNALVSNVVTLGIFLIISRVNSECDVSMKDYFNLRYLHLRTQSLV